MIGSTKVRMFTVDEAHCVSQWGNALWKQLSRRVSCVRQEAEHLARPGRETEDTWHALQKIIRVAACHEGVGGTTRRKLAAKTTRNLFQRGLRVASPADQARQQHNHGMICSTSYESEHNSNERTIGHFGSATQSYLQEYLDRPEHSMAAAQRHSITSMNPPL